MESKKVLVVDDEIHIVHVVAIKLRSNGFEVVTASNGAEAYAIACSEKPDIVVTDFQMPVMDGLELVGKLREDERTKSIPVIMLTGRNFSIENEKREQLRISECLGKPFSPKELLNKIIGILSLDTVSAAVK
jgi:two-component system, OmpR family, alkaline phosphatase synthesis response regulator PhoP